MRFIEMLDDEVFGVMQLWEMKDSDEVNEIKETENESEDRYKIGRI